MDSDMILDTAPEGQQRSSPDVLQEPTSELPLSQKRVYYGNDLAGEQPSAYHMAATSTTDLNYLLHQQQNKFYEGNTNSQFVNHEPQQQVFVQNNHNHSIVTPIEMDSSMYNSQFGNDSMVSDEPLIQKAQVLSFSNFAGFHRSFLHDINQIGFCKINLNFKKSIQSKDVIII